MAYAGSTIRPNAWQGRRDDSDAYSSVSSRSRPTKVSCNRSLQKSSMADENQSSGNSRSKPRDIEDESEDEMNMDSIPCFEMPTSPSKFTAFAPGNAAAPGHANPEISPSQAITTRLDDSDVEDESQGGDVYGATMGDLIDLDDTESVVSSLYPVSSTNLSASTYTTLSTTPTSSSEDDLVTPEPECSNDQPFFRVEPTYSRPFTPAWSRPPSRVDAPLDPHAMTNWMSFHPVNDPLPPPPPRVQTDGKITLAEIAKRKKTKSGGTSALRSNRQNSKRGNNTNNTTKVLPLEPKFDEWQSAETEPTSRGRGGVTAPSGDDWGPRGFYAYQSGPSAVGQKYGGW